MCERPPLSIAGQTLRLPCGILPCGMTAGAEFCWFCGTHLGRTPDRKASTHLMTVGATVVSMNPGREIAGIALRSWLAVSSVSS